MQISNNFLSWKDFHGKDLELHTHDGGWKRDAMKGGQNYGGDWNLPQNRVLVGWKVNIKSDHNTKGNPDIRMNTDANNKKNILIPVGVHVGHRLTPPNRFGGPSASFQFRIQMYSVTKAIWKKKYMEKLLQEDW